jgi:hypothetical protein
MSTTNKYLGGESSTKRLAISNVTRRGNYMTNTKNKGGGSSHQSNTKYNIRGRGPSR